MGHPYHRVLLGATDPGAPGLPVHVFITLADPDSSGPMSPDHPCTPQFTRDGVLAIHGLADTMYRYD